MHLPKRQVPGWTRLDGRTANRPCTLGSDGSRAQVKDSHPHDRGHRDGLLAYRFPLAIQSLDGSGAFDD